MSLNAVYADSYTRAELGASGLVEVTRNLWGRACQTCADPLGEDTPALVVFEQSEHIEASLHHPECCPPQWTHLRQPFRPVTATHLCGLIDVPTGDGSTYEAMLILNPTLERVRIEQTEQGQWLAASLTEWESHGLARGDSTGWMPHATVDARAWYWDGALTVEFNDTMWHFPDVVSRPGQVHRALIDNGRVTVAVSTALDPERMGGLAPLRRVISAGEVLFGQIPLTVDSPPPPMPDEEGMPDDFDGMFPGRPDEAIELPVTAWEGPSYDPATGTYRIGIGADGPRTGALNTPGVGVHSSLLVGPPECGKTNALRIAHVEALHSGVFYPVLADPLDHNGHRDAAGQRLPAEMFTDTLEGTVAKLEMLARIVDYRTGVGGFTDPTHETPGVLLFLEDADKVFSDPRLAELGARIATAGEPVGVGIIATAERIDLECFAGRLDLIVGLGRKQLQAFSEKALAQFRIYKSRT